MARNENKQHLSNRNSTESTELRTRVRPSNRPLCRLWMTIALLAVLISLLCQPTNSQQAPTSSRLSAQVDRLFSAWDKSDSPGCALSVMKSGDIIYKRGYGMADLDHDLPITPSSVFHAASLSKQFTAMAIMLLVNQGKLSLDDEVRKYIPQLPDFGTPLTIRHLLQHTSGLRDQWSLLVMSGYRWWEEVIKDEDVLDLVSRMKSLNYRPGDQYLYGNTGYTLAGWIVKKVSGQTLREFCDLNIFKPLGMTSTLFRDDHAIIVKRQAYGYRQVSNNVFLLSMPNFDTNGPSNLLTTVEDLARWDRNFFEKRVGGDWIIEQMQTTATLNDGERIRYALGQRVESYRGLRVIEHSGGDAGFRTHFMRFPDQRFSVACLCNTAIDASAQSRRVADIYLERELAPLTSPTNPVDVFRLTDEQKTAKLGAYWSSRTEDLGWVTFKDGRLHLNVVGLFGSPSYIGPLFAQAADRFRLADSSAEISFEAAGHSQSQQLIIKPEGGRAMIFDLMPPATRELADYVGNYYSDEIDTTYRVVLDAGKLTIKRRKFPPTELQPVFRDGFTTSSILGYWRFTRVSHGSAVDGLILSAGRVRGFRFVKQPE